MRDDVMDFFDLILLLLLDYEPSKAYGIGA